LAAVIFALGVWFTGSVTSDFTLAMAFTAAWFALAALASLAVGLKRLRTRLAIPAEAADRLLACARCW
jgi:hypothetical protein